MKKVLSAVLAVMMLFSFMTIGASAETNDYSSLKGEGNFVVILELADCKMSLTQLTNCTVYTFDGKQVYADTVSGTVIIASNDFKVGTHWDLPTVTTPEGNQFDGWRCYLDGKNYAAGWNGTFNFPDSAVDFDEITFKAQYSQIPEGDTMATILSVLTKVFGAIIGILLYGGDTEAGVAMVNKILGGLEL